MRISRDMRLMGAVLLGMLMLQGAVTPPGACEMTHESADMSDEAMSGSHHSSEGDQPRSHHDSAPMDCVAMSGCGVPAVTGLRSASLVFFAQRTFRARVPLPDRPIAVDLGLTTPPPKI